MKTREQVETEQLTFSVSLHFIALSQQTRLITCYFQSSGGERALPIQTLQYAQGLE